MEKKTKEFVRKTFYKGLEANLAPSIIAKFRNRIVSAFYIRFIYSCVIKKHRRRVENGLL